MIARKPFQILVIAITLVLLGIILAVFFNKTKQDSNEPFIADDLYLARSNKNSFASAVKKSAPAVTTIQTHNSEQKVNHLGSGIIFDAAGHILTNYHVIKDAQEITVRISDGRILNAQLVGSDPQTDLAVLIVSAEDLPTAQFGKSKNLQVGDQVLAIGNPFGLTSTVTLGIVSGIGSIRHISEMQENLSGVVDNIIQTDAAINLGNSGGPLIDSNGRVIGVNTAIIGAVSESQGIGFAIPIDTAINVAQQLIAHGKVTRGWIGAQLADLPTNIKKNLKFNAQHGIYIQDTVRNSPAQKAGLLPGDIITKINNEELPDVVATVNKIASLPPHKICDIEIFRNGDQITYSVYVEERF